MGAIATKEIGIARFITVRDGRKPGERSRAGADGIGLRTSTTVCETGARE